MAEQTPDQPTTGHPERPVVRRPYEPPAIVYEVRLDARAGSPMGLPDPLALPGQP